MVARLVDNDPLPLLVNAIHEEIGRHVNSVLAVNGLPEQNYRIMVGYVRALNWVLTAVEDLAKKQEET